MLDNRVSQKVFEPRVFHNGLLMQRGAPGVAAKSVRKLSVHLPQRNRKGVVVGRHASLIHSQTDECAEGSEPLFQVIGYFST